MLTISIPDKPLLEFKMESWLSVVAVAATQDQRELEQRSKARRCESSFEVCKRDSVKMSFLKKDKKYGLVMPKGSSKSGSGQLGKVASIFDDDSSEEDEKKKKMAINRELNVVAEQRKQTHQTRKDIQKALEEDPSVYQYDEIYDEMESKKVAATQATKTKDKKPRYIANLLKSAEVRKREQERRVERTVQKEREQEGDEFADKESFVTSAYRQKMIDQAEEEERLRKQDEADAKHDVRKQKDLSQFYRNLLDNNVAMGASQDQTENPEKKIKGNKKGGETIVERDVKQEVLSESDDETTPPGKKGQESPSGGQRRGGQRGEGQRREGQRSGSRSPSNGKGSSKIIEEESRSRTVESRRNEEKGRKMHDTSTESSNSETEKKQRERRSKKQDEYRPAIEGEEGRGGSTRKERQMKLNKLRREASSSDSEVNQGTRKHQYIGNKTKPDKKRERSEDSSDEYSKILPLHLAKEKLKSRKESKGRHYRRRESSAEESDSSPDRKQRSNVKDEKSREKVGSEKTEDAKEGRKGQSDVGRRRSKDKAVSHKRRERPLEDGAHDKRNKERDGRSISTGDVANERSQRENRKTRDRKRSRDRKDSPSLENKENESDSSEENNTRPSSKDKQLKRENVAKKQEKRSVFAKRNDEQSILAARERYLERKRARIAPETFDDDSD